MISYEKFYHIFHNTTDRGIHCAPFLIDIRNYDKQNDNKMLKKNLKNFLFDM